MALGSLRPAPHGRGRAEVATTKRGEPIDSAVTPGQWHKAVVEIRGGKMLAQIDGGQVVSAESARIDVEKTDLGFPVGGVSALLDNVKVFAIR